MARNRNLLTRRRGDAEKPRGNPNQAGENLRKIRSCGEVRPPARQFRRRRHVNPSPIAPKTIRATTRSTDPADVPRSECTAGCQPDCQAVHGWLKENGIRTLYIERAALWQNGFVESFHGRLRDECLNREQQHSLTEAWVVIGDYRQEQNQLRPHRRLGHLFPGGLRQESPFLHRGWTFRSEPTTINQRLGLSHPQEQFRRPGQLRQKVHCRFCTAPFLQ